MIASVEFHWDGMEVMGFGRANKEEVKFNNDCGREGKESGQSSVWSITSDSEQHWNVWIA